IFYCMLALSIFLSAHLKPSNISQPVSFQTAKLGDPVTFECQIKSADQENRVWYKVNAGRRLQLVVRENKLYNRNVFGPEFLQSSHRYSLKYDSNIYHLSISAATREDTGTYYCGVLQLNFIQFGPGTFLMLKGTSSSSFSVAQQPVSKSVQPGHSVTLSCSVHTGDCGGEDTSVFWLKSSRSSGSGIIYNSGNKSESCERTESGSPQTSCVYKLPKQNLSSDDAGTYYCVVASCGEILFGNGTKLNIKRDTISPTPSDLSPTVIALTLSNIILGIATILLIWALCKSRKETVNSSESNQVMKLFIVLFVNYAAVTVAPSGSSSRTAIMKHSRDAVLYSEVRCQQQTERVRPGHKDKMRKNRT
uniref:Ig-like domain-containing protein n=1 Tax=Myripristis murdjan TaxID=586833 RepID=A0A667ZRT0_9TELE